jgi:hypothetical protein
MQRGVAPLLLAAVAAVAANGARGQQAPPAPASQPVIAGPVAVPEGNGSPVITDGLFTAGEWEDALRVVVADTVTMHLKEYRGVVFIGVRGQGQAGIGPSELSLAAPGGPIQKLHVSAQLAEALLPTTGAEPSLRFGLTVDWYANELRRDEDLAARLMKEGRSPIEVITASSYPSDGIELAIRRSKLPGKVWLLRLWASAFVGGKPGMIVYPPAAAERATDGWLELHLR